MKAHLILASLLITSLIAFSPLLAAENAIPIYTENKPDIMVMPDQPVFTLKLKSNPSTGYSWFLREYNADLITPIKYVLQKSGGGEEGLMGAPNYELWTFRVKPEAFVVPQQTIVRMTYIRPWQDNDNSTQIVFSVTTKAK